MWYMRRFNQWWRSNYDNTLRPRQNCRHSPYNIFKCNFVNENVLISIKIWLKFVPKGPLSNILASVQMMAWQRPDNKPLSQPMLASLLSYISACVTLWRQLQTRFWDARPRASVKNNNLWFSYFFRLVRTNYCRFFPLWLYEWVNDLQFSLRSFNFLMLKFYKSASFCFWAIIRWN